MAGLLDRVRRLEQGAEETVVTVPTAGPSSPAVPPMRPWAITPRPAPAVGGPAPSARRPYRAGSSGPRPRRDPSPRLGTCPLQAAPTHRLHSHRSSDHRSHRPVGLRPRARSHTQAPRHGLRRRGACPRPGRCRSGDPHPCSRPKRPGPRRPRPPRRAASKPGTPRCWPRSSASPRCRPPATSSTISVPTRCSWPGSAPACAAGLICPTSRSGTSTVRRRSRRWPRPEPVHLL